MKLFHFLPLIPLLLATSCNNGKTAEKDQPAAAESAQQPTIAYVEIDSLNTQLTMCREARERLESQAAGYRRELDAKSSSFQKAYAEFAQKMQSTGYASQQEYEAAQQRLQKMQEDGTRLEQKYAERMARDQEEFNQTLRDSVRSYLAVFNADKRYTLILSKSGDNILYSDPALDITDQVVKGMNKRYGKKK